MEQNTPQIGLTAQGCRGRQQRLRDHLRQLGLHAALIGDSRHVHYFTGFWHRPLFCPMVLIEADGPTTLAAPLEPDLAVAADKTIIYESNRGGTLTDHQPAQARRALEPWLSKIPKLGGDQIQPPGSTVQDLTGVMLELRRGKDDDEIALLQVAFQAAQAAYRHAAQTLRPGLTEVELYAGMQAAAVSYLGEGIGEFGNDFQIGSLGSAPRRRPAQAGEAAILDVSVVVRGYACDMCRSFIVGGRPSDAQLEAHARIMQVLAKVQQQARPGVCCRQLHQGAIERLDGYNGWTFKHHLGHGVGLCHHEAPRLNVEWDDRLQVGDVFVVEPGLYGPDLRAGLRVEEAFHLTKDGLRLLTSFPTGLG